MTTNQQHLIEEHIHIVKSAIHKSIIVNDNIYGFEYDDLFQEGCIWLCKAATTYDANRKVQFATYAEKVVTNGLRTYCRLMCGKQKHMVLLAPVSDSEEINFSFEQIPAPGSLEQIYEEQDIYLLLEKCKQQYKGTTRLGIEAIEWKVRGFSGSEIAKIYNVKPNLVGAWIYRAATRLKQNKVFMQYFNRVVEKDSS